MKRDRFLGRLGMASLVAACVGIVLPEAANAQTKPLQKVRMLVATGVLDVTYTEFTLPKILGYWRDEGYDVDVQPAGGSVQGVQQVVGGGAELAAGSGNAFISGGIKANVPLKIAMTMRTSDWAVAVDANGPIKSAKDLKDKTIGVFNLATGGILWLNELLIANGYDPTKDVNLVPTAMGATPVQALQAGRVQGLLYWGSAIASFENTGLKVREISGDDWNKYPDYSIGVREDVAQKDPNMVISVIRGVIKGMVFLKANPECAVRLHWAAYPSSKAPGNEAAVLKADLHSIARSVKSMDHALETLGGGKLRGNFDEAAYQRLIDFMVRTKQLEKPIPISSINVPIADFHKKINDFDHKAVEAQAKACKV